VIHFHWIALISPVLVNQIAVLSVFFFWLVVHSFPFSTSIGPFCIARLNVIVSQFFFVIVAHSCFSISLNENMCIFQSVQYQNIQLL
jgi:hypothetical protein